MYKMGDASENGLKICVLGVGAAGLAVVKIIKDSSQFKSGQWTVDAFEEREDIGGTWLPAPVVDKKGPPPTPMYDSIITNLPHPVMCYPSFWFPPSTPLFPKAEVVQDYLHAYVKEFDLMSHVHLNSTIVSTRWTGTRWKIRVINSTTNGIHEHEGDYDKLVIANGHYRVPYYPSIPGLSEWRQAGRVTHALWYRHPIPVGDDVLVIGGGFSGIDIAEEMGSSGLCEKVVHAAPHSVAEGKERVEVRDSRVVRLSEITDKKAERIAYFEDGSSAQGIDHIFLATGYILSFPFFPPSQLIPSLPHHPRASSSPPEVEPLPDQLYNSAHHLFPILRFLFPLTSAFPPTSAAFVGLPIRVAPLPLFEAQARAVVRVFADPSSLDVDSATKEIYEKLKALRDDPNVGDDDEKIALAYNTFKGREQFEYRDKLNAFAFSSPSSSGSGSSPFEVPPDEKDWRVPEWCVEAYENMVDLRKEWKRIIEAGEAEDWVKGVGEGKDGREEWAAVLRRLLERAKERRQINEGEGNLKEDPGKVDTEREPEKIV